MTVQPPRSHAKVVAVVAVVAVVVGLAAYLTIREPSPTTAPHDARDSISASDFSLCATNCLYPSPYLSGLLDINGTTPFVGYEVYANGTLDGLPPQSSSTNTVVTCVSSSGGSTSCSTQSAQSYSPTSFILMYKGGLPSRFIPAVAGDPYVITFVGFFEDGSNATATVEVVAYS